MNPKQYVFADIVEKYGKHLQAYKKKLTADLTRDLQKRYKGKKVKCKCFDAYVDGDDYYFEQELIDICATLNSEDNEDRFQIEVVFLYQSPYAQDTEKPKNHSFHLEFIKVV